jgi:hypothetical protein
MSTVGKSQIEFRQIRALYDDETITVYQAYSASIATAAVREQKLSASPDFSYSRMTWIKPSWTWMMFVPSPLSVPNSITIRPNQEKHQVSQWLRYQRCTTGPDPGDQDEAFQLQAPAVTGLRHPRRCADRGGSQEAGTCAVGPGAQRADRHAAISEHSDWDLEGGEPEVGRGVD